MPIAHSAAPVVRRARDSRSPSFDGRFAAGQREVAAAAGQSVLLVCQCCTDCASAGGHTDEISMDLIDSERIVENVGVGNRLDNGAFKGGAAWLRTGGAAPPYISCRGESAAAHVRQFGRSFVKEYEELGDPGFRGLRVPTVHHRRGLG